MPLAVTLATNVRRFMKHLHIGVYWSADLYGSRSKTALLLAQLMGKKTCSWPS
jgi:hypothetical protein